MMKLLCAITVLCTFLRVSTEGIHQGKISSKQVWVGGGEAVFTVAQTYVQTQDFNKKTKWLNKLISLHL